jgi:WXG100 family type VII secretion target
MAMANIAVSTANMKQALQEFTSCASQCRMIDSNVQTTIQNLSVAWSGDVATRFRIVMTEWQERFTRVTGALHLMEESLARSIHEYEKHNAAAGDQVQTLGR